MSEKLRATIARELLTILAAPNTPNIIALDCELKKKYASPARPWPYTDAEDAATCFRQVAAEGQKKYAGITIETDKSILRLIKTS